MASFPAFRLLPAEIQDMIWDFSLPGPRIVEYRNGTDGLVESLVPFQPATALVCMRSRCRTLKRFRQITSPRTPGKCIGFMDLSRDTLLLKETMDRVFDDDLESGINNAAAERMDRLTEQSLRNESGCWNDLRYIALSVPVFIGTVWSGGGFSRVKSSPTLNSLYKLPALEGIAIVSTAASEIQDVPGQAQADFDRPNVWRFLTINEGKAGWAVLMKENLIDNYCIDDSDEDANYSWEDLKRKVWPGGIGPEIIHVGLETVATREELTHMEKAESGICSRKRKADTSGTTVSRGSRRRCLRRVGPESKTYLLIPAHTMV